MRLRSATLNDVSALVELNNLAGEGLSLHGWQQMAEPGETGWDVGRRRTRQDVGVSSWRNATVVEEAGAVVACLIGYPLPEAFEPIDVAQTPSMFRPLAELERLAPGTWYINVLAAYPAWRGHGLGTTLISHAASLAAAAGCTGTSLIVADTNAGARRLYERTGHIERARRTRGKGGLGQRLRERARPPINE